MRVLTRNKQSLWYSNPTGVDAVVDSNGLKTGERTRTYSTPTEVKMSMSISSGANNLGSQGMAEVEAYGLITGYTHRALTEDMNCAMYEESRVWYGILPTKTVIIDDKPVEQPVPHNFVVVRKAKSLNHLIYYLKEVDVG